MLTLDVGLLLVGLGLLFAGTGVLAHDLWRRERRRFADAPSPLGPLPEVRWRTAARLAGAAALVLIAHDAIAIVPGGMAGVCVGTWGTRPGTLYPGIHLVRPLVDSVVLFGTRERALTTGASPTGKAEPLMVQTKEGLSVGLSITVRYRLDPQRLDHIQSNLPQPVETEIVPPVVASTFRQVLPGYTVREVFSTKREEVRQAAADAITQKLGADGILVKEVMLRDVGLPAEYARGLEGLLLKEQENERMVYVLQLKEKEVRQAELQAEAEKARQVKQAEGAGQVRVLQAKAEADAMQHTLPLKEKQIQQTRLEAEARKESTLKNAEAAAQAKVIESRADLERGKMMAEADANRIRVTSTADAERMRQEALVLKDNPLLIQKIVAERLSDKMQIMMVPMDGRNFFANDIFRAASTMGEMTAPKPPAPAEGDTERPAKVAKRR